MRVSHGVTRKDSARFGMPLVVVFCALHGLMLLLMGSWMSFWHQSPVLGMQPCFTGSGSPSAARKHSTGVMIAGFRRFGSTILAANLATRFAVCLRPFKIYLLCFSRD